METFEYWFEIKQRGLTVEGAVHITEASESKARAYVESLFAEKAKVRITHAIRDNPQPVQRVPENRYPRTFTP